MPGISGPSRRAIVHGISLVAGFVVCSIFLGPTGRADEFARLVGPALFDLARRADAHGQANLSIRAIEALPEVLRGERAAFVVVITDQGNVAKLLLSSGMHKRQGTGGKSDLVPVITMDRFETIDARDRISFKARGRDVILFEGFQFDLDSGQVVPEGFGGDIRLTGGGSDGPDLQALGTNKLYTFDKPIPVAASSPGRPSSGRAVLPADFIGRYTLIANGQISGALEIAVAPEGAVSGRFRSDRNGAVYPVTGKVVADLPRKIEFTIQFPRSSQDFEGLLWTEEKNAFAGTVSILGHPYSFFALREGSSLPSDSIELHREPIVQGQATRIVMLEDGADRYTFEGVAQNAAGLGTALAEVVRVQPAVVVLLRVPESLPFERVYRASQLIRNAGVSSIRVAPKPE